MVTRVDQILPEIKATEGVCGFTVGRMQVQVTLPVDEDPYHSSLNNIGTSFLTEEAILTGTSLKYHGVSVYCLKKDMRRHLLLTVLQSSLKSSPA